MTNALWHNSAHGYDHTTLFQHTHTYNNYRVLRYSYYKLQMIIEEAQRLQVIQLNQNRILNDVRCLATSLSYSEFKQQLYNYFRNC